MKFSMSQKLALNRLIDRFRKDADDKATFRFETLNESDYELTLTYRAHSKILTTLWKNMVESKMFRKMVSVRPDLKALQSADPSAIKQFDVPSEYLGRVHSIVKKNITKSNLEVKKDGIIIMRSRVDGCRFYNEVETTMVEVKVVGQYARRGD